MGELKNVSSTQIPHVEKFKKIISSMFISSMLQI